jgi:hypothetical protein
MVEPWDAMAPPDAVIEKESPVPSMPELLQPIEVDPTPR